MSRIPSTHVALVEAARTVLATWHAAPYAIIRLDLKRALEALQATLDGHEAAAALVHAHDQRTIDHEAWARAINGNPGEDAVTPGV